MRSVQQLIKFPSFKRWAIVGTFTLIIDYLIFIFLYSRNISIFLSNFYSGFVSIMFNYLAHSFWTFEGKRNHFISGIKYLTTFILIWILGSYILNYFILTGFEAKIAKLMYLPIITPLSYFLLKIFVFRF